MRCFQVSKESFIAPETVMSRISFDQDMANLQNVDYIVENVVEKVEVKEEVYRLSLIHI